MALVSLLGASACNKTGDNAGKETVVHIIKVTEQADSDPGDKQSKEPSKNANILKFKKAYCDSWMQLGNQAGNNYSPKNLIDGNPATTWAVKLSQDLVWYNDIVGPILVLSKPSHIDAIELTAGYCKNSASFKNNTRPAWIEIARWDENLDGEYAEGQAEGSEKKDIIYQGPVKDTMSPQRFEVSSSFDNSKPTKAIVLRFKDPSNKSAYYRGAKWNDLCVSEVKAFGK